MEMKIDPKIIKRIPSLVISVPYSDTQTEEEAVRNVKAVRWAEHALAQVGFYALKPVSDSVHFRSAWDVDSSDEENWREWCRESMKQRIMHGLVQGTVILFPNAERSADSQIEVKAAEMAKKIRGHHWVFYIDEEDGILQLPENIMEMHQELLKQQYYC